MKIEMPIGEDLRKLTKMILNESGEKLTESDWKSLHRFLCHPSWFIQTLVSDILNQHGEATIPEFLWECDHTQEKRKPSGEFFTEVFEARISVDEYALYEAVHPAYAKQVFEMIQMIDEFGNYPEYLLDVGIGPGLPTLMVSDFFPNTQIDAVEPSPAAFGYLCKNIEGLPITPFCCGIMDFEGYGKYDAILSVGASHHLDTNQFLRCCRRLVKPGHLVVIADEMISPYSTREQRTLNLIKHHWVYICEAISNLLPGTLPPPEQKRLELFQNVKALTPDCLEKLLSEVSSNRVIHENRDSPWPRIRLAVLELEALVAGIHYDVERKTYPENFITLATDQGLELLKHVRVHPTHGQGELSGGTHVFCFRRPY